MHKKTGLTATLLAYLILLPQVSSAEMIKFISLWEVPADDATMDQWYRTVHSQEVLDAVGPWLTRYWTYRAIDVPPEDTKNLNVIRYRLTEMWYDGVQSRDEAAPNFYTLSAPPMDPENFANSRQIAQLYVAANPSHKFVDTLPRQQKSYLRWVYLMRYPQGVSVAQGEEWFLNVHAQALTELPGLRRFVSYQNIDPVKEGSWVRVNELWFDDYPAWKRALLPATEHFVAPAWNNTYPFVEVASIFTSSHADMNFLRQFYRVQ